MHDELKLITMFCRKYCDRLTQVVSSAKFYYHAKVLIEFNMMELKAHSQRSVELK